VTNMSIRRFHVSMMPSGECAVVDVLAGHEWRSDYHAAFELARGCRPGERATEVSELSDDPNSCFNVAHSVGVCPECDHDILDRDNRYEDGLGRRVCPECADLGLHHAPTRYAEAQV